jgi:hypothetical protein
MLDESALSTLYGMTDLYIVGLGGGQQDRTRREAEREAERRRLADRYARYLVAGAEVGEATARRVITALFDHCDADGNECLCSCHPRLSAEHGDSFDCRCTWDEDRRAAEATGWQAWWDSPEAAELSAAHRREEDTIAAWLVGKTGVDARRTSSYAPEQWEGTVDGRTFYFRERDGLWRIELDMVPSGRYAQRLAQVGEDGTFVTEPVPIMEGEVIAQGAESDLGAAPVDHIAFVVRTIRDHLRGVGCEHHGARLFCPDCGQRTGIGS